MRLGRASRRFNAQSLVGHFHSVLETMTCSGAQHVLIIAIEEEEEPDVDAKAASWEARGSSFPSVSSRHRRLSGFHHLCVALMPVSLLQTECGVMQTGSEKAAGLNNTQIC